MATDPSTKPSINEPAAPGLRPSKWSRVGGFLIEADYLWQSVWAAVLSLVGLGALIVAIVNLNVLALALALVALPIAIILWLSAKGVRDALRKP